MQIFQWLQIPTLAIGIAILGWVIQMERRLSRLEGFIEGRNSKKRRRK